MSQHQEQLPDGSWVIIDDDTGMAVPTDPFDGTPGAEVPIPPDTPNISGNQAGTGTGAAASGGSGTPAFDMSALKWLGALVLLWIILTALTEYSANAAIFGQALAGLVLLGALFYLGPDAIKNVKNVWADAAPTPGG